MAELAPDFEDTQEISVPSFEDTTEVAPSFDDTESVQGQFPGLAYHPGVETPVKNSGMWESFKEKLSSGVGTGAAFLMDLVTPPTAKQQEENVKRQNELFGGVLPTEEPKLTKIEEGGPVDVLAKKMQDEAAVSRKASELVYEASDPRAKNAAAQLGRGVAGVVETVPALLTGGLPLMALQGAGQAYESAYQQAINEGKTPEQATQEGDLSAVKTAPALLLYMAGGKAAAGLAGKLLGKEASALTKGLVGSATASVANIGASSVIRALEAKPGEKLEAAIPTIESLTADTLFGVYHGVGEYRNAKLETKRKAYEELQKRGFEKEDLKTAPTEQKSEAIVEKTPDQILQEISTAEPPSLVEEQAKVISPEEMSMVPKGAPEELQAAGTTTGIEAQGEASHPATQSGPHIISTGIKTPEGIATGEGWNTKHADIIKNSETIKQALAEGMTPEQIDQNKGFVVQDENGNRTFVGRKRAIEIARKSGQVDESILYTPDELISEALIQPTKGEPNALQIDRPNEEIRGVQEQPTINEGQVPTEGRTGGVPPGAQETAGAKPQEPAEEKVTGAPPISEPTKGKIDWTSATEEPSKPSDIKEDIRTTKEPASIGLLPSGSTEIHETFDKIKAIAKEALEIGKVNDLRRGILHWVARIQKSFGEVSEAQKTIQKAVKDPVRRDAITVWIEAAGDTSVLKQQASQTKDPKLRAPYEAAKNLTPEETALANKIKDVFDTLHKRGVDNDVLQGFRDNYVNHIWEKKPQRLTYSSKSLRDNFRFSRARVFTSFFEGEQAGFKPRTKDISKLLPVYIHEMNSVIAARQLVTDLSKGTAGDGRPLVSPTGMMKTLDGPEGKSYLVVPKTPKNTDVSDYKVLQDQPALTSWRWKGEDENGNPIFVKSDLALHPEAYERLRKALGQSEIRRWYNTEGSQLASIPKSIVKAIDATQSTVKQTMLGFLSTFHVVQEATHAIGHKVSPFHVEKIDLNRADQYDATKHGLMLNPDRISENQFMEGVGKTGIISKIPGVGKVADVFSNWMFHEYIPGLKWKTYERIFERNIDRFKPEMASGEVSKEEVKVLSAEQTNAAYGHLNYADLGRDPTIQHLMQMALLAPDFLEARGRFAAQAAKGLTGAKSGREQLAAVAFLAASQFVASQILNKLIDGKFHFDHPFEVINGDRRYTLRSVPEDIFNLFRDTRRFIYGRLNPITTKGGWQLITGINYRGEKVDTKETLTELLAQSIPLTLQAVPAVRNLTETGKNQPISPLEQFAGSMGLRVSRYSPISEVYQLASKYEDKQGVPRDRGTYPISKYQQLRYALEDGDEEKAKKELEKLGESMKRPKIASGFKESIQHPFTQSERMDVEFAKSLSPENYEKFKLAKKKREDILRNFYLLYRKTN